MVTGAPFSAASDASDGATAVRVQPPLSDSWLAAQGRLPLAFMGLGLAWLAGATAMLVVSPGLLALPHAAPAVVALAHAWILGFFVTIATGAIYQLAPVALGSTLWSERCGWWHFWLQLIAVPGMVFSFWRWDMELLGHFGTGFAAGIFLFALNTWKTVRRSPRKGVVGTSLLLAAGWLFLTVTIGLVLAANRFWHFLPLDPLGLLRAHAHLGLVGFFLTLLQGVSFQLIPMFILGDGPSWPLVRRGLWCSQLGLVGLVPSLIWHAGILAACFGACIVVGMLVSGEALRRVLATRKKRPLDPGLSAFVRGAVGLPIAGVFALVLVWPASPGGSAPGGLGALVYGVILLLGGLLPTVAGMICKIVPFLTWMRAYGPQVGRMRTPSATALSRPRLQRWALGLQGVSVLPLAAGTWLLNPVLLTGGAWILGTGVLFFLADMAGVLSHLWRRTPPAPAKPA